MYNVVKHLFTRVITFTMQLACEPNLCTQ